MASSVPDVVQAVYRAESRRLFARLVRRLGDFDLAEDALQSAVVAALAQWPDQGVPNDPTAWLYRTAWFKGVDAIRSKARWQSATDEELDRTGAPEFETHEIGDDLLRLIFTCCHPALSRDAQIALTLREVCEMTTEEIARAFLTSPSTLAQRIVRAKAKIRDAKIPFESPGTDEFAARLEAVLRTIYLVFNEGYSASSGDDLIRRDLTTEAIRLGRLLTELLPEPEALGLLALMLLHDARREARQSPSGDIIRLEDQDRSKWNRMQIREADDMVRRALRSGRAGPYTLQAAIAAVHTTAESSEATDWEEIVGLYDALLTLDPSPVVALNRAVAVAMLESPQAGLTLVDDLIDSGALDGYHLAYVTKGELLRRWGDGPAAAEAYRRALELTQQEPERRLITRRLEELSENS